MNDKSKTGLALASIGMIVIIFSGAVLNMQSLIGGVLLTLVGFYKFFKHIKNEG